MRSRVDPRELLTTKVNWSESHELVSSSKPSRCHVLVICSSDTICSMPVLCASDFQSRSGQLRQFSFCLRASRTACSSALYVSLSAARDRDSAATACRRRARWSVCSSVPVCRSLVSPPVRWQRLARRADWLAVYVSVCVDASTYSTPLDPQERNMAFMSLESELAET